MRNEGYGRATLWTFCVLLLFFLIAPIVVVMVTSSSSVSAPTISRIPAATTAPTHCYGSEKRFPSMRNSLQPVGLVSVQAMVRHLRRSVIAPLRQAVRNGNIKACCCKDLWRPGIMLPVYEHGGPPRIAW